MRWLAALLVAACASPEPPPQCSLDETLALAPADAQESVAPAPLLVPHAAPPPPWQPAPAVEMPAPVLAAPPARAVVAGPSQAMRTVAVVADGTAAVSADIAGNVRLWPALDGTREPIVVAMRRPVTLAVTRSGSNALAIAGLDGAGQLELLTIGSFGEPRSRTSVDLPRPATRVLATSAGFLVERDDQHLVFVTLDGAIESELDPPAGTDIAAIAVHGDAMLALLAGGGAVHGRWLSHAGHLHWGDQTAALPIAPRAVALAPDHKRLAAVVEDGSSTRLAIVGLANGERLALGPDSQFLDPSLAPLRFLDSDTVVFAASQGILLWHSSDDDRVEEIADRTRAALASGGGSIVAIGSGADLMIGDSTGNVRFLGFRVPNLSMIAAGARSLLAADGQHLIRIGPDLREHASYDLPVPQAGESSQPVALLDGSHVLVQAYRATMRLEVVALDTLEGTPVDDEATLLAYDPATRIAAFAREKAVRFRRYDPRTGTFGPGVDLATASASSSVTFSDGGAFVTTYFDDSYVVRTVTAIRPERGTLSARRSHEVQGRQAFVEPEPLPYARTVKSPDGTLAASVGGGKLALRDATGKVHWMVPSGGTYDLAWLRSGELIAIGGGLARVDVATGAFVDRRCGWEFGLWSEPSRSLVSASVCEAE